MWPDDEDWLPRVLGGGRVLGSFHLDAPASPHHQAAILAHDVKEIDEFPDSV